MSRDFCTRKIDSFVIFWRGENNDNYHVTKNTYVESMALQGTLQGTGQKMLF